MKGQFGKMFHNFLIFMFFSTIDGLPRQAEKSK